MANIIIHTFGYRYGIPEANNLMIFDVSNLDINIKEHYYKEIMLIQGKIRSILIDAMYTTNDSDELIDFHFYIGCECGHHKSVEVGEFIAEDIPDIGYDIWTSELYHRDINKPLVDVIPKRLYKKTKKDNRKKQCSCGTNY